MCGAKERKGARNKIKEGGSASTVYKCGSIVSVTNNEAGFLKYYIYIDFTHRCVKDAEKIGLYIPRCPYCNSISVLYQDDDWHFECNNHMDSNAFEEDYFTECKQRALEKWVQDNVDFDSLCIEEVERYEEIMKL